MHARKLLVAATAIGALTIGTAGAAFADTTTPPPSTPTTATCAKAPAALARLQTRKHRIEHRIDLLQQADAKAKTAHRTKLVTRLEKRIDRSQRLDAALTTRMTKIETACKLAPPVAAATPGAVVPAH